MPPELYVGLMSGTSLDGIDAVLVDLAATPRLLAHLHRPFALELRDELLALNHAGADELERAARAANTLAEAYAALVQALLPGDVPAAAVAAIGCHGQTVRHRPDAGYSLQLVNGALLAEKSGMTVVCDFRSRDIAAGGQGAPLVPAFHHAVFAHTQQHRAIVNIGGIANITDLPTAGGVSGFDCGPGNLLLDAWAQRHLRQPYDAGGAWARSGSVLPKLLARLLAHPYFDIPPPKSAGRDTFNMAWLETALAPARHAEPADVQATLLALTARGIADAAARYCGGAEEIYVCGGGARNGALMSLLENDMPGKKVATSAALGMEPEHVEAMAFAWLAQQTLQGKPGNLPDVTGARGKRILGAVYSQ